MPPTTTLLLTASAVASASDVEALTRASGGQAPAVATRSTVLSLSDFDSSSSSFSIVRSLATAPSGHASAEGAGVLRFAAAALAPGGTLELAEELTEPLKRVLLLAGFVEAAPVAKKPEEEDESGSGSAARISTTAKKPDWSLSVSAAVTLPAAKGEVNAAAVSAWDAAAEAAGDGEEEEETIDEDALLAGDDLKPKIKLDAEGKAVAAAPCPPTKSACKDCSCGRAEREAASGGNVEAPKLTREMIENPQSNCGSCGLGDAFRCGGCPYRGLPPFQPGKKIELPPDFLIADS